MAVWSYAIYRPSTQRPNFDPAYLDIVAAGVRSVFSQSGSFCFRKRFVVFFSFNRRSFPRTMWRFTTKFTSVAPQTKIPLTQTQRAHLQYPGLQLWTGHLLCLGKQCLDKGRAGMKHTNTIFMPDFMREREREREREKREKEREREVHTPAQIGPLNYQLRWSCTVLSTLVGSFPWKKKKGRSRQCCHKLQTHKTNKQTNKQTNTNTNTHTHLLLHGSEANQRKQDLQEKEGIELGLSTVNTNTRTSETLRIAQI